MAIEPRHPDYQDGVRDTRRGNSMVPYIVAAIVVVAGIFALMMYGGTNDDGVATGTVDRPAIERPAGAPTVPAPANPAGAPPAPATVPTPSPAPSPAPAPQ